MNTEQRIISFTFYQTTDLLLLAFCYFKLLLLTFCYYLSEISPILSLYQ